MQLWVDIRGSSLPLMVFGLLLILVACVVAFTNVGMTRDQINAGDSINNIFGDYLFLYGIAFILGIIGAIAIGLGFRR